MVHCRRSLYVRGIGVYGVGRVRGFLVKVYLWTRCTCV